MSAQIVIPNINQYHRILDRYSNRLVLNPKPEFIEESKLFEYDLRESKITECCINDNVYKSVKYRQMLIHIYKMMDKNDIISKTTMNVSQQKVYEKGFMYYDDIGLSIQGADSRRTLKEIIRLSRIQEYTMKLSIKLKNNKIVKFSL
jgi:hypothetical protein